ncbi:MAG: hypothetical protein ACJ741_03050 [Pyrinomonadaceae bacterium]
MIEEEMMTDAKDSSAGEIITRRMLSGKKVRESDFERAVSYDKVQPGDLITAEWMNKLLKRLARLELLFANSRPRGGGAADSFTVFGETLVEALRLIKLADSDFQVGLVLDVEGVEVKPNASGAAGRRVLGQFLALDEGDGTTAVNLLVSAPNANGRSRYSALGTDAKEFIAQLVYTALETQLSKRFTRGATLDNATSDVDKQRATGAQTPNSIIAEQPAASAKSRARKGGRKAGKKVDG